MAPCRRRAPRLTSPPPGWPTAAPERKRQKNQSSERTRPTLARRPDSGPVAANRRRAPGQAARRAARPAGRERPGGTPVLAQGPGPGRPVGHVGGHVGRGRRRRPEVTRTRSRRGWSTRRRPASPACCAGCPRFPGRARDGPAGSWASTRSCTCSPGRTSGSASCRRSSPPPSGPGSGTRPAGRTCSRGPRSPTGGRCSASATWWTGTSPDAGSGCAGATAAGGRCC